MRAPRIKRRLVLGAPLILLLLGLSLYAARSSRGPHGTTPDDSQVVARGRALYQATCAGCHGALLQGQPEWKVRLPNGLLPAPPHDGSGHTWHHADGLLFAIVHDGGASVMLPDDQSGMPAFGDHLSDDEIWAVLSYIKSTWPADIRDLNRQVNLSER